jgi:abnormal spindle-like microcephaly-associated protein
VIAPSDTHKKKLQNCTMAIQYIKQAGVLLSDADGVIISAEDIANGDKELILSLIWNIFIHMQVNLNMLFSIALMCYSMLKILLLHCTFRLY